MKCVICLSLKKRGKPIGSHFMRDEIGCDRNTIIVGHSSGAEAAMRFVETYSVKGIILVSACVTDCGDDNERESGYYDGPWNSDSIRANSTFIVQFGTTDDQHIPWAEQQDVADGLLSELHRFEDDGYFKNNTFPELLNEVVNKG